MGALPQQMQKLDLAATISIPVHSTTKFPVRRESAAWNHPALHDGVVEISEARSNELQAIFWTPRPPQVKRVHHAHRG